MTHFCVSDISIHWNRSTRRPVTFIYISVYDNETNYNIEAILEYDFRWGLQVKTRMSCYKFSFPLLLHLTALNRNYFLKQHLVLIVSFTACLTSLIFQ